MTTIFLILVAAAFLSGWLMEHHRRWELEQRVERDARITRYVMDMVDEERTRG